MNFDAMSCSSRVAARFHFVLLLCLLPLPSQAQQTQGALSEDGRKETLPAPPAGGRRVIRCYWIGSSSSPLRLLRTFDDFVNAGTAFSTTGSVRGDTVRLDLLAAGDRQAKPIVFKGVHSGDYEYIVVQMSSGFTRNAAAIVGMDTVVADLCRRARALGAAPVLWEAYAAGDDPRNNMKAPERQAALHRELVKIANKHHVLFAPAGSAWQEVRMSRPDDRLYMFSQLTPHDLGHTGPRGNFILGASIYAAITGENPVNNPNLNTYEMDPKADKKSWWSSAVPFAIAPEEAQRYKDIVWKHTLILRQECK